MAHEATLSGNQEFQEIVTLNFGGTEGEGGFAGGEGGDTFLNETEAAAPAVYNLGTRVTALAMLEPGMHVPA
jgi:hypothetical protein